VSRACADAARLPQHPFLERRIIEHERGFGANLVRVIRAAGIDFVLARTWNGDRSRERRLKNTAGSARFCPVCVSSKRRKSTIATRPKQINERSAIGTDPCRRIVIGGRHTRKKVRKAAAQPTSSSARIARSLFDQIAICYWAFARTSSPVAGSAVQTCVPTSPAA